ncbi:hypothetical protein PseudUWO310_15770 [Pseudanabaena sp. UWO310]|nr:hypothetical protein PseudUWO310_15770 [Pseudanabaena sp. UWO310]
MTCFLVFRALLGALRYIEGVSLSVSLVVVMPKWFNTAGPCKPDIHCMLLATDAYLRLWI